MPHMFRNPLEGYPESYEVVGADGVPSFRITPRVLTPFRAKARDQLFDALLLAMWVSLLYVMFTTNSISKSDVAVIVALGIAASHLMPRALEMALLRRSDILMTADTIAVRGWLGWQRYSRHLEHRFALHVHDRAQEEYRDNDFRVRAAAAHGKVVAPAAYYGSSFHVVLVYAGHRVDLLTVFGQRDAAAIIARLQYCDRCLNEALAMGGGIPKRPEDEWNDAPGGVHHD